MSTPVNFPIRTAKTPREPTSSETKMYSASRDRKGARGFNVAAAPENSDPPFPDIGGREKAVRPKFRFLWRWA